MSWWIAGGIGWRRVIALLRNMARPTKYTVKLGRDICRRIAGGESLVSVCVSDGMPCRDSVYQWIIDHDKFSDMYAHAREQCADAWFDEALRVSGEADSSGDPKLVPGSRLYVDTLKWAAAKLRPRAYSDKVQIEQSGITEVVVRYADDQSDAD